VLLHQFRFRVVDTALKIALAYHRVIGQGTRTRLIGRERGYHGVGFGGISVGGIVANRKHVRHAADRRRPHAATPTTRATPSPRASRSTARDIADDLIASSRCTTPSTIAAVIVEPVAGSTGVLIPPKGYLKRCARSATKHGILLIFDEVITGFGRLGTPFALTISMSCRT
jgi:beta-alanine--pyruvate transaminase